MSRAGTSQSAGVTEDYILIDVKMAPSSTVSGIASAPRYEIEGIGEADLKKHLNHQVEFTGTITQPDGAPVTIRRPISRHHAEDGIGHLHAAVGARQRLMSRTPNTGVTSRPLVASKRTVSVPCAHQLRRNRVFLIVEARQAALRLRFDATFGPSTSTSKLRARR